MIVFVFVFLLVFVFLFVFVFVICVRRLSKVHRGTCLACHLQSKVADILTFLFDFEFVILYSAAEVTNGGSIGKLVQPVPENQKRLIFLRFCLCNSICVCICPCVLSLYLSRYCTGATGGGQ